MVELATPEEVFALADEALLFCHAEGEWHRGALVDEEGTALPVLQALCRRRFTAVITCDSRTRREKHRMFWDDPDCSRCVSKLEAIRSPQPP